MSKKKTPHKKHKKAASKEDQLIEEGLRAIYDDEVDFSTLDRGPNRFTQILMTVVITLAVIAIAAWVGFYAYTRFAAPQEENHLVVEIQSQEELVSGERAQIAINYQNPSNVPLANLEIDVNIPNGFIIDSISPTPDDIDEYIWQFGSLSPNSDGVIVLEGMWFAEVPDSNPVQVFSTYRPANFNADFSTIETQYITTTRSALETVVTSTEEGHPGDSLEYQAEITNTSTETINNVTFSLQLPNGFFLEESSPAIEAGAQPVWTIDQIEPAETITITYSGSFAADQSGFQYIDTITAISVNDMELVQGTEQAFTDLLENNLNVQLVVNGSTEDAVVELGKDIRITVALENTGDTPVDDATVLLDFATDDAMPILWSEADLQGGSLTSAGISWDATDIGIIAPGEKWIVNTRFPADVTIGTGQADQFAVLAHTTTDGLEVKSTPITLTVATEAAISSSIRYFNDEGAPLGSGPLPPQVGEVTSYRLFWQIDNTLHDLEGIRVSASLPPDVEWMDSTSADLGSISYQPDTRTITWRIERMPNSITTAQANVAIRIIPDSNDVGNFVKLVSGTTFEATDTVTGTLRQSTTESLNSELPDDEFAHGKGVVIE